MSKKREVIGQKFNKLLIIDEIKKNNEYYLKCKCDCGNITIVKKSNVLNGHTQSCGCKQKNKLYDKLVGKRYGKLVVLKQLDKADRNGHKHFICKCDCGNQVEVLGANLIHNQTQSCGCKKIISQYTSKTPRNNKSGVKGVFYDIRMEKWIAKITINSKVYKSSFDNKEDAVLARKKYEDDYYSPLIEKYNNL